MKARPASVRPRQPTPKELTDDLLGFIQRKFYPGEAVQFAKDRSRLLAWAVLWPAAWLNGKAVSISTERYREVCTKILMEARIHGTEKVRYRPAWLRQVMQSHFRIHGEELYNEAKALRALVENALLLTSRTPTQAQPDPIRELARAQALVAIASRPKKAVAQPDNQRDLFA